MDSMELHSMEFNRIAFNGFDFNHFKVYLENSLKLYHHSF